ncbi:phosphodiester glycosidase family protein [Moorellaceae bacterium AZ2]
MRQRRVLFIPLAAFLAAMLLAFPLVSLASPLSWQVTPEEEEVPLSTGVRYSAYQLNAPNYDQRVQVLTIDPADKFTVLETALSYDNLASDQERPSAMAARLAREGKAAVAATNGDFYSTQAPYLPIGLQISRGELLISPQGFPALGVTQDKKVLLGTPIMEAFVTVTRQRTQEGQGVARFVYSYPIAHVNRQRGEDMLILYTPAFAPTTETNDYGTEIILKDVDLPIKAGYTYSGTVVAKIENKGSNPIPLDGVVLSGHGKAQEFLNMLNPGDRINFTIRFTDPRWHEVTEAIGGRDIILRGGQLALPENSNDPLITARHPRTAIGVTKEGRLEILVADGRQPGYSEGMTLYELAEFMRGRGIVAALNLDGGGSSVLAARKVGEDGLTVLNRPSDGGERAVTNALVFFSTAPKGELSYLYLIPSTVKVYKGSQVEFSLKAQDNYYNPAPVPDDVTWQVSVGVGRFISPGLFLAEQPGKTEVTARVGEIEAVSKVDVVDEISRLTISPTVAFLEPGSRQQFRVRAFDVDGEEILVDPSLYSWSVTPGLGEIDPETGELSVTGQGGSGLVKVRLGDREAVAEVNPTLEVSIEGTAVVDQEVTLVVTHKGMPVVGASVYQVEPSVPTGRVTASALYIRTGPGTGNSAITLVPRGYTLEVLAKLENGWLKVRLPDGRVGYAAAQYVALQQGSRLLGQTDAQGKIRFTASVAGQYVFTAQKQGYLAATLVQEFRIR